MEQYLGSSSEDFLPEPVRGGRGLTTEERRTLDLSQQIPGWGSDLDPAVRPGVPMDKSPYLGVEDLYPDIEPQIPRAKVHKSTEHGEMPPVFGNVCPPRGLSGKIRDLAYKFSEGRMAHWLLLMTADRIDVVEEFVLDLAKGQVPNVPAEMGIRASWKHNRKGVIQKTAVIAGVGFLVWLAVRPTRTGELEG